MSREPFGPDSPDLWMDYAKNDLRMAEDGVKRGYRLESLCFHAQQAAEKALKAVLVQRRILFPKSHDLERLMDLFTCGFVCFASHTDRGGFDAIL